MLGASGPQGRSHDTSTDTRVGDVSCRPPAPATPARETGGRRDRYSFGVGPNGGRGFTEGGIGSAECMGEPTREAVRSESHFDPVPCANPWATRMGPPRLPGPRHSQPHAATAQGRARLCTRGARLRVAGAVFPSGASSADEVAPHLPVTGPPICLRRPHVEDRCYRTRFAGRCAASWEEAAGSRGAGERARKMKETNEVFGVGCAIDRLVLHKMECWQERGGGETPPERSADGGRKRSGAGDLFRQYSAAPQPHPRQSSPTRAYSGGSGLWSRVRT